MNTLPEEASICAGCCSGVSGSWTDWETSSAGQEEVFKDPEEEMGLFICPTLCLFLYIVFLWGREMLTAMATHLVKKKYKNIDMLSYQVSK